MDDALELDAKRTLEIHRLLNEFYTEEQARLWLNSKQPQLDGETAMDAIRAGHGDQVLLILRRMSDGVYL